MKTYSVFGFVLSLILISSHSSAYALIDLNVGGKANSNTAASSSGSVEVNVGTEANTSSSSSSGSAQAEMDSRTTLEVGQNLSLTRSTLQGEAAGTVETSSEAVITNADLRAYAGTALRADGNLEELNFTGEKVEVSYKQRGRLLALVPITFKAKAVASADGNVELDYPWYAFMTVDDQEKIKTELKVAVDNALKARAVGSVRAEGTVENPRFTAAESAEVASEMHTILRSNLEASETVDGTMEN